MTDYIQAESGLFMAPEEAPTEAVIAAFKKNLAIQLGSDDKVLFQEIVIRNFVEVFLPKMGLMIAKRGR